MKMKMPTLRRALVLALTVVTVLLAVPSMASADAIGTSPLSYTSTGSGSYVITGTPTCATAGQAGSNCGVACAINGGAYSSNFVYANPFPWCDWNTATNIPGATSGAYNLDVNRHYCPNGYYSWSFYGTVAHPDEYWAAKRIPVYNDCPNVQPDAWALSPSPADAGHPNVEISRNTWAHNAPAGTQRHEFPNGAGLALWNVRGQAAVYTSGAPDLVASAGSCTAPQTNVLSSFLPKLYAAYTQATPDPNAVKDVNRLYNVYQHYITQFPGDVRIANVKSALPQDYPPISSARALLTALMRFWTVNGAVGTPLATGMPPVGTFGTGAYANGVREGSFGYIWPCGSVFQYAQLSTAPAAQHAALGTCTIATNVLEFGASKTGTSTPGFGAIPVFRGATGYPNSPNTAQLTPMGGTRFAASKYSGQSVYSNVLPRDPALPSSLFSGWRRLIAATAAANKLAGQAYVGPDGTDISSSPNYTQGAAQASQLAYCVMDAMVVFLPVKPSSPVTTTSTTSTTSTTTTTFTPVTTTLPPPTTTLPPPPAGAYMQTMSTQVPVFVNGGSLRVQQITVNVGAFDRSKCITPSRCYPNMLKVRATIEGTGGYTRCTYATEQHCSFYVISPLTQQVSPNGGTFYWKLEFFYPTTSAQHVVVKYDAGGTYIDFKKVPIMLCVRQKDGSCSWVWSGRYKYVALPPKSYSVQVTSANPVTREVSGGVNGVTP